MINAYITRLSSFLPNYPVSNEDMEEYLGLIKGGESRFKNLVLRNNGIKTRYYAIRKDGSSTHSNAQLTAEAIKMLYHDGFCPGDIELLACGTSSADHLVPSHASMVQGLLDCNAIEVMSPGGTCNAGMLALKYGYLSVVAGMTKNAVCAGSEKNSIWMRSELFEEEAEKLVQLGENPFIAFQREFLRWMLSDGAGAFLIENKPANDGLSLRINWIEIKSYANELETCMYAGGMYDENGKLVPWREISQKNQMENSVFALQQDTKLLEKYITLKGTEFLYVLAEKYQFNPGDCDFFLPHLSSAFFQKKIVEQLDRFGMYIPEEKWFTNLQNVGNLGAASAFVMLSELFHSGKLVKGNTILMMVPESARFSYTYMMLTVV
jgi:3-oxoacyl-[acyl-carrier-protein] synthase III